ncbi:hypothetical protein PATA110615_24370 [Paenibacillus taichungensis]
MLSGNTWKFAVRVIFYIGLIRYDKNQKKHPDASAGVMMMCVLILFYEKMDSGLLRVVRTSTTFPAHPLSSNAWNATRTLSLPDVSFSGT